MSKADKKGRHHLHIELTQEQYLRLTEQASACGLSKRAYLVRLMEGKPIRAKPSQEIKDLRWEVHKIGVNINQIAKKVNTTGDLYPEEMEELKRMVSEIWRILKSSPLK